MEPVASIDEVRAADRVALESVRKEVLIARAGYALSAGVIDLLGNVYGMRIGVLAGKGNNGNDGRAAGMLLGRRGARIGVFPPDASARTLVGLDCVIDASFGTGFHGEYHAPLLDAGTRVVAADIPSGIDAMTGQAHGTPMRATRTVTFAIKKPGLLLGSGRVLSGEVIAKDIGVAVPAYSYGIVNDDDLPPLIPHDAHKWDRAVVVVAGSPRMEGAGGLCCKGALRAGAGLVQHMSFGTFRTSPKEAIRCELPTENWGRTVLGALDRAKALVIGPGCGRDERFFAGVREIVEKSPVPIVIDADALLALDESIVQRSAIVLTPHDGEYAALMGHAPGSDRLAAVKEAAKKYKATVLLKGPTTVIASSTEPWPKAFFSMSGDQRLATPGTGDVLSGIVGAFLARAMSPLMGAAVGAYVHGKAALLGPSSGFVASLLPPLVSQVLSEASRG
jgi:NAD(P)H-hydrate epimerase